MKRSGLWLIFLFLVESSLWPVQIMPRHDVWQEHPLPFTPLKG
jgi:hypothetical protein